MWRYAESTQDFVDIARHRKGDGFCNGVECNCETNIGGAGPVDFDIVQELKGGDEVISALWGGIFDAEVIDNERENSTVGYMPKKAWGGGLSVPVDCEVSDETLLRK